MYWPFTKAKLLFWCRTRCQRSGVDGPTPKCARSSRESERIRFLSCGRWNGLLGEMGRCFGFFGLKLKLPFYFFSQVNMNSPFEYLWTVNHECRYPTRDNLPGPMFHVMPARSCWNASADPVLFLSLPFEGVFYLGARRGVVSMKAWYFWYLGMTLRETCGNPIDFLTVPASMQPLVQFLSLAFGLNPCPLTNRSKRDLVEFHLLYDELDDKRMSISETKRKLLF